MARANAHVTYPARVQLVAAMNPCKCGYLGDPALGCGRAPKCGADYQARLSGPLLDRIDLHVEVPAVNPADLSLPPPAEGSAEVAARVAAPDADGRRLLTDAAERLRLSARGYHRVLRVARTLADLAGGGPVRRLHIAEALSYRRVGVAGQAR